MKYGRFPIKLKIAEYAKPRGLAIQMINKADDYDCDEPFAIEKYKLGKPTGKFKISGFCCYPLYEFDLDEIAKYGGVI